MVILRQSELPPSPCEQPFICTRDKSPIRVEEAISLRNPEAMKEAANIHREEYRGIEVRSISNFPYNCVGLVFASRRAWIEIDYVYDILKADGYRRITRNVVMVGDLVLYKDDKNQPAHIGMVASVEQIHPTSSERTIFVLSKWGRDPEFVHLINRVPPQLGEAKEFYTEGVRHEL